MGKSDRSEALCPPHLHRREGTLALERGAAQVMIRMGPHGERAGSSKRTKGEGDSTEDQEAMDLAADWSDISQGLRKDLGQQLHSQWIRPIQVGSFCKETGTLDLFLPTEFSANWVSERFADRLNDPWKRWKTGTEDYRNRSKRKDYLAAIDEMFQHTDTRWAPWKVIDGNNKKAARIAALTHIAETLEAAVPMTPPDLDPAVVKLAHKAFGYAAKD